MTCIVGIVGEDKKVWIGGDSLGVAGYSKTIRADEKVFRNSEFLIGCTSSFRMIQILRYCFDPPRLDTWDVRRYMAREFVGAAREAMKAHGWERKATKDDGYATGEIAGGTFLVAVRGQLFEIEDDFQVGVPQDGVAAVGCGAPYALGAMFASSEPEAFRRAEIGLEAASRHSAGVGPPFMLLSDQGDERRREVDGRWVDVVQGVEA